MFSVTRTSLWAIALSALVGSQPASAATTEVATRSAPVCTLVSGGLGTDFDDLASRLVWSAVNRQVHEHLVQRMQSAHHHVQSFFAEVGQGGNSSEQRQAIYQAWLDSTCPLLVQVSHVVEEAAGEPVFGFDITVAALQGPTRLIDSRMNQRYRFPRNKDSFENFRVGELVEDIVVLLAAKGSIDASVTVGPITASDLKAEHKRLAAQERQQARPAPPFDQVRGRLVLRIRDRLALTSAGATAARGTAGER